MQSPPSSQLNEQPLQQGWVRHPNDQTVIPKGISLLVKYLLQLFVIYLTISILQIEGRYIYTVDIARLRQHAVALDEIFSNPSDEPLDGTPSHPVSIPYITGDEFSHFVNWFNHQ
jgi:hypothetical protein